MTQITNKTTFFIPFAESPTQTEEVYESIKIFLNEQNISTCDERIYSVQYSHNGHVHTDTVGEKSCLLSKETVIAIFKSSEDLYLICTYSRGVVKGEPMLCNPIYVVPFAE